MFAPTGQFPSSSSARKGATGSGGLDRWVGAISRPIQHSSGDRVFAQDAASLRSSKVFLSNGTFREPIGSTGLKDVVVGCENRESSHLLSLAWACQIAAYKYYKHRSVASSKSANLYTKKVDCHTLQWLQKAPNAPPSTRRGQRKQKGRSTLSANPIGLLVQLRSTEILLPQRGEHPPSEY